MAAAIRAVNRGYAQLSPEIASKVFAQIKPVDLKNTKYLNTLSPRELEVLQLVGRGKNNREIAQTLHLKHYGVVLGHLLLITYYLLLTSR